MQFVHSGHCARVGWEGGELASAAVSNALASPRDRATAHCGHDAHGWARIRTGTAKAPIGEPMRALLTLVGVTGFEPATSSSRTTRATKLRHTPRLSSCATDAIGSDTKPYMPRGVGANRRGTVVADALAARS